jgi:hypothetical protein
VYESKCGTFGNKGTWRISVPQITFLGVLKGVSSRDGD